jgi:hypothetical protein
VRKLRYRHRWSQITFATKLQHCGWNVSRETLAKIESRRRTVLDVQVLGISPTELLASRCSGRKEFRIFRRRILL